MFFFFPFSLLFLSSRFPGQGPDPAGVLVTVVQVGGQNQVGFSFFLFPFHSYMLPDKGKEAVAERFE